MFSFFQGLQPLPLYFLYTHSTSGYTSPLLPFASFRSEEANESIHS